MAGESRRALVVIHGIGVQQRASTQRVFVEGLKRVGVKAKERPSRPPSEVPLDKALPPRPVFTWVDEKPVGKSVDVFELYWAPHTSHQTTARSVIAWLLGLTFLSGSAFKIPSWKTLFDMFLAGTATIVALLFLAFGTLTLGILTVRAHCSLPPEQRTETPMPCPPEEERKDKRLEDIRESIIGEAATLGGDKQIRAVGLEIGSAAIAAWRTVIGFSSDTTTRLSRLSPAGVVEEGFKVVKLVPLQHGVALIASLWVLAHIIHRLLHLGGRKTQKVAILVSQLGLIGLFVLGANLWIVLITALGLFTVLAIATRGFHLEIAAMGINLAVLVVTVQFSPPRLFAFGAVLVFMWAVTRQASSFLSESIGDVQVYSETNENNPHYEARANVLAEAEETLKSIEDRTLSSGEPQYERVTIVGHSLGSVVAIDAVQRLHQRRSALLGRIDSIVTVGTAIEKVGYFFRRDPDAYSVFAETDTADVRDRFKESRHPEEMLDIAAKARAIFELVQGVELLDKLIWLNLWYFNDIVANPVTTFRDKGQGILSCKYVESGGQGMVQYKDSEAMGPDTMTVRKLVEESPRHLVVNVGFGWMTKPLPFRGLWPHSAYWTDERAMAIVKAVAYR